MVQFNWRPAARATSFEHTDDGGLELREPAYLARFREDAEQRAQAELQSPEPTSGPSIHWGRQS